jgi:peroxiredoxin
MKTLAITLLAALTLWAGGTHSNRRAPGFSLMDTHFEQHDMQDYLGKVVLVDFMKTDCPVCNQLADTLVVLNGRYGDKLAVLSIVTLPDSFDLADKFAAQHKSKWPILFDSGQVMMSWLQMKPTGNMNIHFPHIFVVDRFGAIRNDFDGAETPALTVGALSSEIDKLLK